MKALVDDLKAKVSTVIQGMCIYDSGKNSSTGHFSVIAVSLLCLDI